jgi:hypothetical protein
MGKKKKNPSLIRCFKWKIYEEKKILVKETKRTYKDKSTSR